MPRRRPRRRLPPESTWLGTGAAIAAIGWIVGAPLLSVTGVLIALTVALVWVWGRESLQGVSYVRTIRQARATFGEEVPMDVELVNDKVLPLTWLLVREEVSSALTVRGAETVKVGWRDELQFVLPMLPFQRVRRHLTVMCDQRGEHRFGPTEVRSGSPLGTHGRTIEVFNQTSLLVYPKVFPLAGSPVPSRVPLASSKARTSLSTDPVRIRGVRPYEPGDPLRAVDWRATARSNDLLVRVHEPTSAARVAVFVDVLPPSGLGAQRTPDVMEFVIAVAASIVSDLSARRVPLALASNGTVRGSPASSDASQLAVLLELLALLSPARAVPLGTVLLAQRQRVRHGTSVLVVSSNFSTSTTVALEELRRGAAVGALWVATERGRPPAAVDASWEVSHDDHWRERPFLDLAA